MSTALSRQCRALREWLPEYAEDKLSGRRRAAVAEHLAGCARCTEEVAELRLMLTSLHAVEPEAVPAHLLATVRASLREPAAARPVAARPAPSLWARLAVPIAAATGLVAIAFALHQSDTLHQFSLSAPPARAVSAGERRRANGPAASAAPAAPVSEPAAKGTPRPQRAEPMQTWSGGRGAAPPVTGKRAAERAPAPAVAHSTLPADGDESVAEKPKGEEKAATAPSAPPALADSGEVSTPAESAAPPLAAPVPRPAQQGGGMGGGGLAAGGGGRGARPPVARPWRVAPPGRYARRYRRGSYPERRRIGRSGAPAGEPGGPPPVAAQRQAQARPPANALVVQTERGQAIALHLEPSMGRKVKVYAGNQVISPTGGSADRVVLPADSMGNAPSQVPITISSEAGDWKYTLFTPGASQVGKQQSTAVRHYQLEPLSQVLADLSAQSGLVLLVEGSTDRKVAGELPLASPQEAVTQLAAAAKLDAYTEDGTVYTLRPKR